MNSAGRSNISSIFQHGLQDGYLSLNPHVKGGLFPLKSCSTHGRKPTQLSSSEHEVRYPIYVCKDL